MVDHAQRVYSGPQGMPLDGVREYAEEMPVELVMDSGRICVLARNESGYNCTVVDLFDLFAALGMETVTLPTIYPSASRHVEARPEKP